MLGLLALPVPICPTALLLRLPCPGCGLTRATFALLRGDVATSFALHPLAIVLAPLLAAYGGAHVWGFVRGRPVGSPAFWTSRAVTALTLALMGALLAVWVARFLGAFGGPAPV